MWTFLRLGPVLLLAACGARTDAAVDDAGRLGPPLGPYAIVMRVDAFTVDCTAETVELAATLWRESRLDDRLSPTSIDFLAIGGTDLSDDPAFASMLVAGPPFGGGEISRVVGQSDTFAPADACDLCGREWELRLHVDTPLGPMLAAVAATPTCR